ncbi:MAG TPA: ATP synthase F1 subunit delta [Thermoanaerobaculia bacterium]|nr:ATP synthase F1 subunit delta [Thermoanaerobaculia bacterium]
MIRRFARPYARALMDVAGSPAAANAVRGELLAFANAVRSSEELRGLYANPAIDLDAKIKLTNALTAKMKLSDLAKKMLEVLVRFQRVNDIDPILQAVAAYVNESLGIAVAEVRSAKNLTPDEMKQLADVLSKKVGKSVELDVRTDPSLLGGLVVKIGSEIMDATVVGKINKFRHTLAQ